MERGYIDRNYTSPKTRIPTPENIRDSKCAQGNLGTLRLQEAQTLDMWETASRCVSHNEVVSPHNREMGRPTRCCIVRFTRYAKGPVSQIDNKELREITTS